METSPNNAHVALQIHCIQITRVISEERKLAEANQVGMARDKVSEFMKYLQHETELLGELSSDPILQLQMELHEILSLALYLTMSSTL